MGISFNSDYNARLYLAFTCVRQVLKPLKSSEAKCYPAIKDWPNNIARYQYDRFKFGLKVRKSMLRCWFE